MKKGDLVVAPWRATKFGIQETGIVFSNDIIRNRIPVFWSGNGKIAYEPVQHLEMINEG